MRYQSNEYKNFKQFHNDCIVASIQLEIRKQHQALKKLKYRQERKEIRARIAELSSAKASTINALIIKDNKYMEYMVTDEQIRDFLKQHPNMNPFVASDLY